MTDFKDNKRGVRAKIGKNDQGRAEIHFFDPSYVRADSILINRNDLSISAILHEQAHFIANIEHDVLELLDGLDEIQLSAPHYEGGELRLKSTITVH